MDSNPRENAQGRDQPQHRENVGPVISNSPKADVPVFSCIVYVSATASGGVQARVANLPGIMCTANSEREALGKIIPAFKQQVGDLMRSGTSIPWIEPPAPPESGEQKRFIPVHL